MEFKGTKGKWKLYKQYDEEDTPMFSIDSKEGILAHCYNLQMCCGTQECTNANALLISKAPEMLEMLKELSNDYDIPHYICERINKLIKEATEL